MVSTASRWLGTARMRRSLAKAGFEVALLAPRGSLALRSRFVSRTGVLRDDATPLQWLMSLVSMINDVDPRIVIPCDEVAIRLLFALLRRPPPHLRGDAGARVTELVRRSLGDPAHYEASIDKTLLPAAAQALGIPVPPYAIADSVDQAVAHAERLGFPVVLKRRYDFASQGVAVVDRRAGVRPAAEVLLRPVQVDLGERPQQRLLVQAFVDGPMCSQTLVAWEGVPLAGFPRQREIVLTPGKGASAVVRIRKSPQIRDCTERLCRAFGMRDMADDDYGTIASFPREWLRDPESPWLRGPADIPWDDPGVFEAMVALRHE